MLLKYQETGEMVSSQQEMGYLSNFYHRRLPFSSPFLRYSVSKVVVYLLCLVLGWLQYSFLVIAGPLAPRIKI